MNNCLIFFLFTVLLSACSKSEEPTTTPPIADQFANTNWVRYGFKSPVSGKDVYYYLSFKENNGIESYSKFNKTELTGSDSQTGRYTDVSAADVLGTKTLKITFNSVDYTAEILGNQMTYHTKTGDLIYKKE